MVSEWKRGDEAFEPIVDAFRKGRWTYKARGPFKIMGIIDNWAMCRFKGAMPFIVYVKDLRRTAEEFDTKGEI